MRSGIPKTAPFRRLRLKHPNTFLRAENRQTREFADILSAPDGGEPNLADAHLPKNSPDGRLPCFGTATQPKIFPDRGFYPSKNFKPQRTHSYL